MGHDCCVEDDVILSSGAALAGHVTLGRGFGIFFFPFFSFFLAALLLLDTCLAEEVLSHFGLFFPLFFLALGNAKKLLCLVQGVFIFIFILCACLIDLMN